jgi:hypothetical protein
MTPYQHPAGQGLVARPHTNVEFSWASAMEPEVEQRTATSRVEKPTVFIMYNKQS